MNTYKASQFFDSVLSNRMFMKFTIILFISPQLWAKPSGPRIFGGSPADQGQFPYLASLRHSTNGEHVCGAAIISENFLLTAAHCTESETPESMFAVVGSVYLDHGGVTHNISQLIIHPDWAVIQNDISLVQLSSPIVFNDNTEFINLPTDITVDPGDDATATGWGWTSVDETPNQLQYLTSKIISNEDCKSKLHASDIISSQICFGGKEGHGMCYGDSGSPLVYIINNSSYAVGIVSWGIPCGVGYPDVFTRVSSYNDWIQEQIGK